MKVEQLEEVIGYHFKDTRLLRTALTHPSYGGDHHVQHYQRLEFLGDAVLEIIVSRYLYFEYPEIDEGKLTRIRAALVREETLARVARAIGLERYILLSVGEERSGGSKKPSILCDVMEAVLAAVYLDGGLDAATRLVTARLEKENISDLLLDRLDAKSRLQEIMQSEGGMPSYEFVSMEGPPHAPVFTYRAMDGKNCLGTGSGTSKQNAQQAAAREALSRMGAKID